MSCWQNLHLMLRCGFLKQLSTPVTMQARGISIWAALRIPGVLVFAATLFCSKLVAYVFLYWLPYYLNAIPIGGQRLTPQASASSTGC